MYRLNFNITTYKCRTMRELKCIVWLLQKLLERLTIETQHGPIILTSYR